MKKVLILVVALFVGLQAQAQLQVEGGYQHFFEWLGRLLCGRPLQYSPSLGVGPFRFAGR